MSGRLTLYNLLRFDQGTPAIEDDCNDFHLDQLVKPQNRKMTEISHVNVSSFSMYLHTVRNFRVNRHSLLKCRFKLARHSFKAPEGTCKCWIEPKL